MAIAGIGLTAYSATLTPEQALQRLDAGAARMGVKSIRNADVTPAYVSRSEKGNPVAYVFNTASEGFVVVSANDVAVPMLGYSEGTFDSTNPSPEFLWWMEEYGRQIEWAESRGVSGTGVSKTLPQLAPVAPLVKTKWDQSAPYNNDCPMGKGEDRRCVTGCVATAMAQMMNYFKYPEVGTGKINYSTPGVANKALLLDLAKQPFDWKNMLDIYEPGAYTDVEAAAVANLMRCCGYSVKMKYTTSASGAYGNDIANSLRTYFYYDEGCYDARREFYSSDEWAMLIYDNLKNVGPVVMNGQSGEGGHSFICDGYDGNGYFHFNWGWSGMSDGYYLLQALNPDAQGIGGYSGGYNFSQNAIIGAQPKKDGIKRVDGVLAQYGSSTATVNGSTLIWGVKDYRQLGWGNPYDIPMKSEIGIIITKSGDSNSSQTVKGNLVNTRGEKIESLDFTGYTYFEATNWHPEFTLPTLADGKYIITLGCNVTEGSTPGWKPVKTIWGYPNYVELTVNGSQKTVKEFGVSELKLEKAEILTDVYYGKNFKIKAQLKNSSDIQLTGAYVPALYQDGDLKFAGESILISVDPGETYDFEWITSFSAVNGAKAPTTPTEYTLGFYEPDIYASGKVGQLYGYYGTVTMNPAAAKPSISVYEFGIDNAQAITAEIDGKEYNTQKLADKDDIKVSFEYYIRTGYFDGIMRMSVLKLTESGARVPVLDEVYKAQPFLKSGSTEKVNFSFAFPDAEEGVLYYLRASYTSGSSSTNLQDVSFIVGESSGVTEISTDEEGEETYYNLQGMQIKEPVKGEMVIVKKGTITTKKIWE